MGDSGPVYEVGTFPSHANDLHTGGILPVVHPRDRLATWSSSIHSVRQRPEVYSVCLEEFPKGYGDTTDHEYSLPPTDRRLEDMLRACVRDHKGRREEHLPLVKFVYNNSYQMSIQMAPYETLYGRSCRSPNCWTEVGESSITGPDLIKDTSEKVSLTATSSHDSEPTEELC